MGSPWRDGHRVTSAQLMTTIYKQYWPVPAWSGLGGTEQADPWSATPPKKPAPPRPSSSSVSKGEPGPADSGDVYNSGRNNGKLSAFSKLDKATLDRLGWNSSQSTAPESNINNNNNNNAGLNDVKCGMTKAEFRRLSAQLRDVSMEFSQTFTSASGLQKSYGVDGPPVAARRRNPSHVYRTQLAASLRVFQHRPRAPLEREDPACPDPVLRCRPASCLPDSRRPPSAAPGPQVKKADHRRSRRPRSVPASAYSPPKPDPIRAAGFGNYDSLDPQVLSQLIVKGRARLEYGDRAWSPDSLTSSQSMGENIGGCEKYEVGADGDASTTSGVDSSLTDESDDSDDEAGVGEEPPVSSARSVPKMALRPDKLDAIYCPPDRHDPSRFSFDAETLDVPPYDFAEALPPSCSDLDLYVLSLQKTPLHFLPIEITTDKHLTKLLLRLVELEKHQSETSEIEKKKRDRQKERQNGGSAPRQRTQKSPAPTVNSTSKNRNCCGDCLQVACAGNCQCKRHDQRCGYSDHRTTRYDFDEAPYDLRTREADSQSETQNSPEVLSRPPSCQSCRRTHTAKYINANNVIMGRPRSGHSTYSRGQGSQKPRDMRPSSNSNVDNCVVKEFEKLGMNTTKTQSRRTLTRPKGRSAQLPGKSFFSQRRNSLTKPSVKDQLAMLAGKKIGSHGRRPKTAE